MRSAPDSQINLIYKGDTKFLLKGLSQFSWKNAGNNQHPLLNLRRDPITCYADSGSIDKRRLSSCRPVILDLNRPALISKVGPQVKPLIPPDIIGPNEKVVRLQDAANEILK